MVFVFAIQGNNKRAVVAQRVTMGEREVVLRDCLVMIEGESPVYINAPSVNPRNVYYFLAVLQTKYADAQRHCLTRGKAREGRPAYPTTDYFVVNLDKRYVTIGEHAGGSHAPPRLHWRRGHNRTYASGTVAWVNAHLVGSKSRGVIVHDYQASGTASPTDASNRQTY